ncbi:MAG: MBL fold metallo-hydrolase [Clostridiales bacterium]|nr:MBL fold metallo-hydrolase [Clostridiales bacterium]
MKLYQIVTPDMGENIYIYYDETLKEGIVVDPGGEESRIFQFVEENDLKIAAVFLTHGHGDHTKGAEAVKAQYHCPIVCGKEEAETLSDKVLNFNDMFGIRQPVVPDILLQDGEVFSFAKRSLRAIATPGHTIGGMCFYDEEAGILFAGDSLFLESIGRTDFPIRSGEQPNPRKNQQLLVQSLREKILTLPAETKVLTGHGPATTVGYEKENNPFCS